MESIFDREWQVVAHVCPLRNAGELRYRDTEPSQPIERMHRTAAGNCSDLPSATLSIRTQRSACPSCRDRSTCGWPTIPLRPSADHTRLEGHAMTPQRRPGMPFVILDKRGQWREKGSLGTASNPDAEQHREMTIDYRCGRRRAHCQGADMEWGQVRYHFSIASPHQEASLPPPRQLRTR